MLNHLVNNYIKLNLQQSQVIVTLAFNEKYWCASYILSEITTSSKILIAKEVWEQTMKKSKLNLNQKSLGFCWNERETSPCLKSRALNGKKLDQVT